MKADVPPGTADQAVALVTSLAGGHWQQARTDFSARMTEALDAARLAEGWARTASVVGSYEGMGEPFARRVGDQIIVEVPLRFEAGDGIARVVFDADGKVGGLWLRPADG